MQCLVWIRILHITHLHTDKNTHTHTSIHVQHYPVPLNTDTHLPLLPHFQPVILTVCSWERELQQCQDDAWLKGFREFSGFVVQLPGAATGGNGFSRGRYTKLQRPQTGAGQTLLLTSGIPFLPILFIFFFLFFLFFLFDWGLTHLV